MEYCRRQEVYDNDLTFFFAISKLIKQALQIETIKQPFKIITLKTIENLSLLRAQLMTSLCVTLFQAMSDQCPKIDLIKHPL